MQDTILAMATRLSDDELVRRVQLLAREEREATVELLAHLAELDSRRLHLALGYGSLFRYCTEALRLAEHAAYNRIEAARASRRFPTVLDRLAGGSLNLSTLRLLAPHLTPENHRCVLDEAARKSKREVEALVARLAPRPDAPASVRKLPAPSLVKQAVPASAHGGPAIGSAAIPAATPFPATPAPAKPAPATPAPATPAPATPAPATTAPTIPSVATMPSAADAYAVATTFRAFRGIRRSDTARRPVVVPLSPDRYRVQFTVGREAHENLRRAQELLRREIPDGDPGAIFERALKLLLEDVARKKLAATSRPRPARPTASASRHIPAHVKRAVWLRDGGQCAFVARAGRRCRERAFLEFHHCHPYAMGGETSVANLSLRCRAHNAHDALLVFGLDTPVGRGSRQELEHSGALNSPRGEFRADSSSRLVEGRGRHRCAEPAPDPLAPGRVEELRRGLSLRTLASGATAGSGASG